MRGRDIHNVQEIMMFYVMTTVRWNAFIYTWSCFFFNCRHFEHCRSKVEPLPITWLQWRLTVAV